MTINDIARLAGVSKSTVSRVLTNHPGVRSETRIRVLEIMEQHQYTPNLTARGLVTGRIQVVGVIVSDIRNPFYSEAVWFLEQELYANGYQMFLYCTDHDPEKQSIALEMAVRHNFSGVILITPVGWESLGQPGAKSCPVVILNRQVEGFQGDTLLTDNKLAGREAARHLLELGHTDIGVLSGPDWASTHRDRRAGFVQALADRRISLCPSRDLTGEMDMNSGFAAGRTLLSMGEKAPTAVFCTTDLMAMGLMQALTGEGWGIPESMSIIGFDDIPFAGVNGISLTTMRQPYQQIGSQAVKLLLSRIQDPHLEARQTVLSCTLVKRRSTGRCRESRLVSV